MTDKKKDRKADISIQILIWIAIGLAVLIIVIALLIGKVGFFKENSPDVCHAPPDKCVPDSEDCETGYVRLVTSGCPDKQACCKKLI